MALSNDLISQFVKVTKDKAPDNSETIVYGTIQESKAPNGLNYVKIDGSDLLTPISSTTVVAADDRVTIMIKNHSAVVTGNLTSPAARSKDTVDVEKLNAQKARIDTLEASNVTIQGELEANSASINLLSAENATIKSTLNANVADINTMKANEATISGKVTANEAAIQTLQATTITAEDVAATYATIENLNAQKGRIDTLESTYISSTVVAATYATIESLNAQKGRIDTLDANKLSAADIEGLYANIDFSNISKATMGQFYANSGLIQNVVVGDSTITGKLVGVTISGDLIEGNTVKAEKLVIKGTDGLYYKLNTDGVTTEAQQTNQNSLDGSVIKAKSITATKVNVTDLVAFGATIGGFTVTDSALYSGTKASAINTTRGIYLGKDAQAAIGDGTSYIKYYKDSDGNYKLAISADSITLCGVNSSGQYIFGNNAAVMYYQVKNVSETATGNAFKVTSGNNTAANNTSSVWFFGAADTTSRYIGSYLAYNRTYSSAANMVVTANGIFGRSTSSSQRYKKDISVADIDELKGLYDLPVKKFKYKEDYIAEDDELYDKYLYGFIVEDLENVLPCAVQHETDTDGTLKPEMWNSNIIVPSLLKLIQDLNNRLKVLEKKGE